jgi:hypothetical protein
VLTSGITSAEEVDSPLVGCGKGKKGMAK